MPKKLLEKNGAEMAATLVNMSTRLRKFMEDEEFVKAWQAATKNGLKTGGTDLLVIYADIIPLLFGDKHLPDTMAILADIEGKQAKEMLKMNGTELIADALQAYKEQLLPFFTRLGLSVGVKPLSH